MKCLKTVALVGLLSVGVIVNGYCGDAENADLKMWQERAAKIKSGTPLAEVKKMLGITGSDLDVFCSGTHCWNIFTLDKNVSAGIDWQNDGSNNPINSIHVRLGPAFTTSNIPVRSTQ